MYTAALATQKHSADKLKMLINYQQQQTSHLEWRRIPHTYCFGIFYQKLPQVTEVNCNLKRVRKEVKRKYGTQIMENQVVLSQTSTAKNEEREITQ